MTTAELATSSGVTASRLQLAGILEAAGLRVVFDPGQVAAPCVLVAPADPWLAPSVLAGGSRTIRWRLIVVSGQVDLASTLEALEGYVSAVVQALDDPSTAPQWAMPTFDAPGAIDVAGAQYLAAVGRVETLTEV